MVEGEATKTVDGRENANSGDTGDVARTVLLTGEREDGVDTRVEDVSIERIFKRRNDGTPVTQADIIDAIDADEGVFSEELTAIVYEESGTIMHLPTDAGTETCDVHYQVSVTLSDTGLGQSETLYQTFRMEDKANRFAEKIRQYNSYTFERHQGKPTLDARWTGSCTDCPDDIAKSIDSLHSRREAMSDFAMCAVGAYLFAAFVYLFIIAPLHFAVIVSVPMVAFGVATILDFVEACNEHAMLFSDRTITDRITLHRESESVCTAEDVRNYIEPSVPTTHVGVTVEQQGGKILVSGKTVNAEWHIETEDEVIADPSAKEVLESAEIHRLENGEADLRIQPATESRAVEETRPSPSLESKSGEWVLFPAETFDEED